MSPDHSSDRGGGIGSDFSIVVVCAQLRVKLMVDAVPSNTHVHVYACISGYMHVHLESIPLSVATNERLGCF